MERLKFTRDWLNDHFIDEDFNIHDFHHIQTSKLDKDSAVKKLVQLRLEYFQRDKDAKDRHEAKAIEAFDEKYPGLSTSNM